MNDLHKNVFCSCFMNEAQCEERQMWMLGRYVFDGNELQLLKLL